MHHHLYDENGRLVQTVVEREPEWDPSQLEMMAALLEYESGLDELGLPRAETMSPLADPSNPDGTHYYEAVGPVRNWAEDALNRAKSDPRYNGDDHDPARKWSVRRVERKKPD